MDYYREHKPRSIIKRYPGDSDSAGNKLTEQVFAGADKLDKFFKRLPIAEITALKIKDYAKCRRKEGDDVREALLKVGKYKPASIVSIGS